MPKSNYHYGFQHGFTVQEIPVLELQNSCGNVFWVDSNKGSDGNSGTFKRPFATIDYAVGRCTASQGDKIFVAAGHEESVVAAGGLTIDIAGIDIYFMGYGTNRAKISLGTLVTASVVISAADVKLVNPYFEAGIDALTGPISITGATTKIINGEYHDGTAIDTTDAIVAAATATGLVIDGWKYFAGDEAGTQKQSHIQLNGVDDAELLNIDIRGDFATGNIENVTDEILNARLENIKLNNLNATPKPGMVIDASASGWAKNVDIRVASGTTYVSSVGLINWDKQCLGYNTDGKGGTDIATFA